MPKPKKNESKQDFLGRCTRELIDREGKSADQAYAVCNAYWDEARLSRPASLTLEAPLLLEEDASGNPSPSAFLITAYTGRVVNTWWGKFVFDVAGMKAKAKIPALREHARDRTVGFADKSWADKTRFYLSGLFSQITADGKEVLALAREGFPWQASVGIWPQRVETLEQGVKAKVNGEELEGPAEIWRESLVGEISFVSLGADDETAAIALSEDGAAYVQRTITHQKEVTNMTLEELRRDHPQAFQAAFDLGAASINLDTARTEAAQAERTRVIEILGADGDRVVTLDAIKDGTPAADTFKRFFEAEKSARGKGLDELRQGAQTPVGQERGQAQGETPSDFQALVKEHQEANKCGKGEAMEAMKKKHPEAFKTWLAGQQKK